MRVERYDGIISMIQKYEYKFKKQMTFQVLLIYISTAYNISQKTAREYANDLLKMNYICVSQDSKVLRLEKWIKPKITTNLKKKF